MQKYSKDELLSYINELKTETGKQFVTIVELTNLIKHKYADFYSEEDLNKIVNSKKIRYYVKKYDLYGNCLVNKYHIKNNPTVGKRMIKNELVELINSLYNTDNQRRPTIKEIAEAYSKKYEPTTHGKLKYYIVSYNLIDLVYMRSRRTKAEMLQDK